MYFESERIIYRSIEESDTEKVLLWRNSDHVRLNFIHQTPITTAEHLDYFEKKIRTGEIVQFVMIEKASAQEFGCVFLKDIDHYAHKAEYGIFIGDEDFLSKHFGTEACVAMIEYAFEEMGIRSLYLKVQEKNKRAIKSYENAGFVLTSKTEEVMIGNATVKILFMERQL